MPLLEDRLLVDRKFLQQVIGAVASFHALQHHGGDVHDRKHFFRANRFAVQLEAEVAHLEAVAQLALALQLQGGEDFLGLHQPELHQRLARPHLFLDHAFQQPLVLFGVYAAFVEQDAAQRLFLRAVQKKSRIGSLPASLRSLPPAPSLEALRGLEGAAARDCFRLLMAAVPDAWRSAERTYHPPQDPANALLSLGYSLATSMVQGLLTAEGLDPLLGMLHQPHHGMPALAADLVEPFRGPLAEAWFLRLVRSGDLRPEHFQPTDEGWRLADPGRLKECVRLFAQAWTSQLAGCGFQGATQAREAMLRFVRSVRLAFSARNPEAILLPDQTV